MHTSATSSTKLREKKSARQKEQEYSSSQPANLIPTILQAESIASQKEKNRTLENS